MQDTVKGAAGTHGAVAHAEPMRFLKRVGFTVYTVSVHFSQTNSQTLEDKVLRLMGSEARNTA